MLETDVLEIRTSKTIDIEESVVHVRIDLIITCHSTECGKC
jgi:hypothetical protein